MDSEKNTEASVKITFKNIKNKNRNCGKKRRNKDEI